MHVVVWCIFERRLHLYLTFLALLFQKTVYDRLRRMHFLVLFCSMKDQVTRQKQNSVSHLSTFSSIQACEYDKEISRRHKILAHFR